MINKTLIGKGGAPLGLIFGLVAWLVATPASAFTVNVVGVDKNGDEFPVSGFRWTLQEDNTHLPQPGVHLPVDTADVTNNTLALSIPKSHAPVLATGYSEGSSAGISSLSLPGGDVPLPAGRYFISVLPFGDHASCSGTFDMGGSSIDTAASDSAIVYVRQNPIETAQISLLAFEESFVNGAFDAGELGLEGFTVTLTDQTGGDIIQDAFGNKLGTTYQRDADTGEYLLDASCQPIILSEGIGDLVTPAGGELIIKNVLPGKYGIQVEPTGPDCITDPANCWRQTSTIEGTLTVDAWVRPAEPPFMVEFGAPSWHVFYGFIKEFDALPPGGTGTITGQIAKGHLPPPPELNFFPGAVPEGEGVGERCMVALHSLVAGTQTAIWAGLCEDGTGNFTIENVPPGTYELSIWDVQLLQIISFATATVPEEGGLVALGTLPVPMWFGQHEHYVYYDSNENGIRDEGEAGIFDQNVNLRFPDGTIYQAFPTDTTGFVPFQEVFPFFHWLTTEVDFARLKATGLRVTNDRGGSVTADADGEGKRNPDVSVQTGPVLINAFQTFAGQNQRYEWGKKVYGPGENGGISGIVFYAVTRAEDDPRYAAGEGWEPGIPRVQVNLYKDTVCNSNPALPPLYPFCPETLAGEIGDGIPDDTNGNGFEDVADVDNYPQGNFPGPEDINHTNLTDPGQGYTDGFDLGDALRVTTTDSWDDSLPEDCVDYKPADPVIVHGTPVPVSQCGQGLRTWNQARPGVFDGGYAFGPHVTGDGSPELAAGSYIVEAVTPPGYTLVKEETRNVDFGYTAIPAILPARCVGAEHVVPPLLSFLTKDSSGSLAQAMPGVDTASPDNAAPFAGESRLLCDRKKVDLNGGQNAAADFFLYTPVPVAARGVGIINSDLAGNTGGPGTFNFTEKPTPPWINIVGYDYSGKEILSTSGDEFGNYNFMAPSTMTINPGTPSGVNPKMVYFCLNDPGPIPDGAGGYITRPLFRANYATTCYTLNFETGKTTFLDTPVLRTAAFVGVLQTTLDCELADGTPIIRDVLNMENMPGAPAYITGNGDTFTITSVGTIDVPNPAYPGGTFGGAPADPPTEPQFIQRNFGFGGSEGQVCVGAYCFAANRVAWSDGAISVDVPNNAINQGLATGQLVVVKPGGERTLTGVTLTVGATEPAGMTIYRVGPDQTFTTIQAAIDMADEDDLILVDPGVYLEMPILYKRVRIQGGGAWSTVVDASHTSPIPPNPLDVWRQKLGSLVAAGDVGLLPGQEVPDLAGLLLTDGEGPGFLVSPNPDNPVGDFTAGRAARIDGLSIQNAVTGGGVYVNAYADRLQLSNLRLIHNDSTYGGGIRVGNPLNVAIGAAVDTSPNPDLSIHHNHIVENSSFATGGGVAIYTGADRYLVEHNSMCGNFAQTGGGGIAHRGLSLNGTIIRNDIAFNEAYQGNTVGQVGGGGGGIQIAGEPDPAGGLSLGSGSVTIARNLIQGNLGGADDGGGIALNSVNGLEVADNPFNSSQWYLANINRNIIVNNVSGYGGAGISLQDAVRVSMDRNTIAHNDSAATAALAFLAGPANPSAAQDAGILSRPLSTEMAALTGTDISVPVLLARNILFENRAWYWLVTLAPDLQFFGNLDLTPGLVCAPNCYFSGNPDPFTAAYFNQLTTSTTPDEGGNFVQVYFTPLGVTGDYSSSGIPGGPGAISGQTGAFAP